MKCQEVEDLIVDYLDGQVSKEKSEELEKHLSVCESCLDMFNDTRQVLNLIADKKQSKPDDTLKINFYHMLHKEIKELESPLTSHAGPVSTGRWNYRPAYRIAAGFAILISFTMLGVFLGNRMAANRGYDEISRLSKEVIELKKSATLTLLRDESSSSRIQAVNYLTEINEPDHKMIEALIKTLNHDDNINVRLTAAFALSKFGSLDMVRDSLVSSLKYQADPIVQVTLINILVDLKETRALNPIRDIMSDENTLDVVKSVAQDGIRTMI